MDTEFELEWHSKCLEIKQAMYDGEGLNAGKCFELD